jgi:phosphohistidine phosphatase
MGKRLASRGNVPQAIISSPAARASATAALVNEAGGFGVDVATDRRIYEARAETLLNVIAEADNDTANLMLVGHNPGTESLIHLLTGKAETMPTAAIAEIDLNIKNWTDIRPGVGVLRSVLRPKDADAMRQ